MRHFGLNSEIAFLSPRKMLRYKVASYIFNKLFSRMCLIKFFSLQVSHLLQYHAHPSSLPSLCYLALKKK